MAKIRYCGCFGNFF